MAAAEADGGSTKGNIHAYVATSEANDDDGVGGGGDVWRGVWTGRSRSGRDRSSSARRVQAQAQARGDGVQAAAMTA
ncbi:hypothetical protein ARSEF1564_002826 [Beauveria bassiana]